MSQIQQSPSRSPSPSKSNSQQPSPSEQHRDNHRNMEQQLDDIEATSTKQIEIENHQFNDISETDPSAHSKSIHILHENERRKLSAGQLVTEVHAVVNKTNKQAQKTKKKKKK
jgi:hypothetical protein